MLRPLDAGHVYNSWDWIRPGVEQVIKRTEAHFRPEDVYTRLRNGTAWLYLIGAEEFGFVVITQEHDPDGMVLFVWCLWTEPHKLRPVKQAFDSALDELAKTAGAKRIRWQSPRNYAREGCKLVAHIYEREV